MILYMKCTEKGKLQKQKVERWFTGAGQTLNCVRWCFSRDDENVL